MSEGRQLHRAAVGAEALAALRQLALPIVVVALLGGGLSGSGVARGALYTLIGAAGSLIVATIQWRKTLWHLDEESVRLRHGVISESVTSVPLDRVQAVDTVRGPVQRLFGVVELHVQAAGGGPRGEIILRAVTEAEADELRAAVAAAGAPIAAGAGAVGAGAVGATGAGAAPAHPAAAAPDAVEWRLSGRALVVAALTSGSLGVLLPVVAGASQVLDDVLGAEDASRLVPGSPAEAALLAGAVLAAAWILSVLGTLVAFAGFTVVRESQRLRIRRGIVERREAAVPVSRVHAVRVVESPLRELFGLAQVRIESAGYASEPATAQTLVPLLRRRDVPQTLARLLPELQGEFDGLEPLPRAAARRYVIPPALAAATAGLALSLLVGPVGLAGAAVMVALGIAWGAARYRTAGWRVDGDRLVIRSRGLARTTAAADAARLQAVGLSANPLQRRAGLATLGADVASGRTLAVRHLGAGAAAGLFAALGSASARGDPAVSRAKPASSPEFT